MKFLILLFGLVMALPQAQAGNFTVSTLPDGRKDIVCNIDHTSYMNMLHEIGFEIGDPYPEGAILKNALAGTKVLVDADEEVTEALTRLNNHGYQIFGMPQDEYAMTMIRPDGSKIAFEFVYAAAIGSIPICILDFDELKAALAK